MPHLNTMFRQGRNVVFLSVLQESTDFGNDSRCRMVNGGKGNVTLGDVGLEDWWKKDVVSSRAPLRLRRKLRSRGDCFAGKRNSPEAQREHSTLTLALKAQEDGEYLKWGPSLASFSIQQALLFILSRHSI